MKITKNQLRKIVKEELMREGFFDSLSDLGKKAMSGLGIGADDVSDEMSADAAQEALDKAFFQYAVSLASQQGEVTGESIEAAQQKALKHVQSLTGHKVMR